MVKRVIFDFQDQGKVSLCPRIPKSCLYYKVYKIVLMFYVLRLVSLICSNDVEYKIKKSLRVYVCNIIFDIHEVKFLAYEVLRKFFNIPRI